MTNTTFQANSGDIGGGMALSNAVIGAYGAIIDSHWSDNTAVIRGGAIFITGVDNTIVIDMADCSFTGNSATAGKGSEGGAMHLSLIQMLMDRCYLSQNSGGSEAGALFFNDPINSTITNCEVSSNSVLSDPSSSSAIHIDTQIPDKKRRITSTTSYMALSALGDDKDDDGAGTDRLNEERAVNASITFVNSSISFNRAAALTAANGAQVTLESTYVWGNAGPALYSSFTTINASDAVSVYRNAWASGGQDTRCDLSSSINLPAGTDGCSACLGSERDICSICNGTSSCLTPGCNIPFKSCLAPVTVLQATGSSIAAVYQPTDPLNPALTPVDNINKILVRLQFVSIIEVGSTGNNVASYQLNEVAFIKSDTYSIGAHGDITTVNFKGFLPNGAKIQITQSLSGPERIVQYGNNTFTVQQSNLKATLALLNWPNANDVELEIRVQTDSSIESISRSSRDGIISQTDLNTETTTATVSLATVVLATNNFGIVSQQAVAISSAPDGDNARLFYTRFTGPVYVIEYDPDFGVLVGGKNAGDGDGNETEKLLLAILIPVLMSVACCCLVFFIVVGVIALLIRRNMQRNRVQAALSHSL
eukprot:TRINITY_DN5436_c1_g1_i3.p1 TRINITY_DN5436_c1_g1~~TRINITY_DN5436_c1_g1_i3.p1  ORF type:complete len:594 (+),score=70.76 TRINITY_DN5436_c1_g1_i3:685-2466(+)